jgi:hypothetical protein
MNNRLLVSVAAIALIGGAGAANAQGGMNREGGAATQQRTEQSYGHKSTQAEPKTTGVAKGQRAEDNARGEKSKNLSTENARGPNQKSKNLSSENQTKGSANMKAEGREGRNAGMKAEQREGRNAEQREGREKNMNAREDRNAGMNAERREGRNAEQREGREKNLNAEGRGGRETERSQMTTGQAGAGAKLSTEQRTRITSVIRNEHVAPINNVDFSLAVGSRIPRDRVHLLPLPGEVITIYPQWRGYEFILVHDEIIVVDPRTLEIVAVLPA